MVSILHISDLHLTRNPNWNMMKRSILSYAEETLRDIPVGEKLLIVTGDFHNYAQDYEPAKKFLCELIRAMDIELTKDVFVVPGNHDVSASHGDYDRSLIILSLKEQESYRNALNQECAFRKYAMPKLLSCYNGYLQFVREIKIYDNTSESYLPVRVHVRTWRNRLHILHLNTTLIADGTKKENQLADALTATSDDVQNALLRSNLPCIAIGHNSYMDLDKQLQTESMRNAFYYGNISAYLCGDQHKTTQEPQDRFIHLKRDGSLPIDNIVAPRGSADQGDNYSEFGMILHQWDERTGTVTYTSYFWKPNDPKLHPGDSFCYKFRNDQTPGTLVTSLSSGKCASASVTPSAPVTPSASVTAPAPETAPATSAEASAGNELYPQERFLADIQSLSDKYGFHTSIGRVCYAGKRMIDTLSDPNAKIMEKSRAMSDCYTLLRRTITDMENDLEDLHPDKRDRIAKLEKALADLKDL